ncbi:UDP-galactopyranose mutase [Helicobacter rodentium]|uniref:UDP-galactopyranose mutase n=1 Tax=Helicobacter rodentium TaxID=59617 RepID=UPI0023524957|nr:UDP-galactopyranose mutase [Helicobacter rodentium]
MYEKFIKGYTQKQWGRDCKDLPASIIRRIPVRLTYDNNYFNDPYQGIPKGGYTLIFEKLLSQCEVHLNTDFLAHKDTFKDKAKKILFTGTIDSYFDYQLGTLEYRSLRFEHETLETPNYQGVAVVNFTDFETPYTRIIEHKHFEFGTQEKTIISKEYPQNWDKDKEPYYPINDAKNQALFAKYQELAKEKQNLLFGGRLGEYRYYDMQDVVKSALELVKREFN